MERWCGLVIIRKVAGSNPVLNNNVKKKKVIIVIASSLVPSIYIYAFSRRWIMNHNSGYTCFACVFLGIEPTTFCTANAMLNHWATETLHPFVNDGKKLYNKYK